MHQEQRLEEILHLLEERGNLTAKEMVLHFNVSKDTIRRDFSLLDRRGLVKRTHGGLLPLRNRAILSYLDRRGNQNTEKQAIADLALELIQEEEFLFLDVSTTVSQLAQVLDKSVTVYSHSLDNALLLSGKEGIDFYLLGGKFYPKNRFYYSSQASETLKRVRFTTAFFGAASLADGILSFEDEEDALLKKLAWEASQTKVLLAETKKFDCYSKYILAKLSELDYWICEQKPEQAILDRLEGQVTILYPRKEENNDRN
ncbi:putative transcriptional regulator (DeoR family) [Streptococcus sp. DD10]|uniref:DeoR/GlpR family DNA-binding transcription regulator n=1 Tax=Streptococcus sp. DD10 TaxID=1777878 RepID=UPI0007952E43|nr:DeoR/GlpR family DNA-binding transcription regulator [Streptococcus sp. DD10]KXT74562.1 putative transcriptional regulator (DeoR family) [Streptococcus sp. DD10]